MQLVRSEMHIIREFSAFTATSRWLPVKWRHLSHFLSPEVTWRHFLSLDCLRATALLQVKRATMGFNGSYCSNGETAFYIEMDSIASFHYGNWRALHHHAACWLDHMIFRLPVSMVKDAIWNPSMHIWQQNKKMLCKTSSCKYNIGSGSLLSPDIFVFVMIDVPCSSFSIPDTMLVIQNPLVLSELLSRPFS